MINLERLLRRAAPSSGSRANIFLNRGTGEEDGSVVKRLSRWRNNAAENSVEAFADRLDWEGLTPETAGSVLGDERPLQPRDSSWPGDESWAPSARRIVWHLTESGSADHDDPRPAPSGVPFAPILAPLLSFAMAELSGAAGVSPLAPSIEVQLREPLSKRLSAISHRAVGREFRVFRDAFPAREGAWRAFGEHMHRGGLLALFERLPVLLRLLATAISLWVEETAEFLRRLEADREDLGRFFGAGDTFRDRIDPDGKFLGAVEKISCGLSDPHRRGRNVKIVRFASGLQVVYKPKSLAIDAAWLGLTEWVGPRTGVALRAPRVLNRGDWGWAEFIPHEPCKDAESVERFYRRAGHLLCLLYATESRDFHSENMVACGEFPVPIDIETVFSSEPFALEEQAVASLQFDGSVVHTLMLPMWMEFSGRSDAVDMSALGSRFETQPETTNRGWIHPNSDAMEFVAIRQERTRQPNTPFLADGACPDAGQFAGKVADGFEEAYGCLMANRDALLSPDGPLEAFRNCQTRLVVRPTRVYFRFAERALNASCLTSGVDRSLEFEGLSRHFLASHEGHGSRAMFRAEVRALEQLDVPYFQLQTDSRDLLDDEGEVVERSFIKVPGYEKVRERIATLSSADRAFQRELIQASFIARDFGGPGQPPAFTTVRGVPESGQLLEAARGIARDIEGRTIWNGAEANWIGLDTLPVSARLHVQPLGPSLYGGLTGMAVFLAAQFAVDGGPDYRRAAVGIAHTLRRSLVDSALDRKTLRTAFLAAGIGGASGAASIVYGLLTAGQILHDEETLDTALCLSRLLDTDAIRADKNLDVIGGAAGAILSLLALWRQTGETELLKKAVLCGERLLETRTAEGAWLTSARRPLAGFSHGAAGIGLALLRLHAAAPDTRFQQAALEGFAYERTLLSQEACNWQDLRDHITDRFAAAGWCHGAPGVALSRIGALKLAAGEELASPLRSDLDFGLRYLAGGDIFNNGTICCGEMGRAEVLLEAARYLDRPELEAQARQRASCVVAGLLPAGERPFIPGFFQGSAGIGYGLLRLIAPDRLPSILLWE
jgi:type 2 lantibiotic biosynthesis protein LanM